MKFSFAREHNEGAPCGAISYIQTKCTTAHTTYTLLEAHTETHTDRQVDATRDKVFA